VVRAILSIGLPAVGEAKMPTSSVAGSPLGNEEAPNLMKKFGAYLSG